MNQLTLTVLSLLLGFVSGFIGGIATGGGLFSIPGLMLLGLPPSSAIATNNLNAISGISSALRFHRSSKIQLKKITPLLLASFIGGLVGSKLLLHISQSTLKTAFAIASVVLALSFVLSSRPSSAKRGKAHHLLGIFVIFLASVFAGLFGTGGGFFVVYGLCYLFGQSIMEANANTKIINLAGAASVIFVFLNAGIINFRVGLPMMVGSTIGGYLGAHTALKKGEGLVKAVFLLVVLASALKLILN